MSTLKPNLVIKSIGKIRIVIILLCLSLLLLFATYNSLQQEAFGHAFVIDTEPRSGVILSEPPVNINAFINEPVDLTYSQISVLGSDGEQVDTGDLTRIDGDESTLTTTLPPDLSKGTYTVSVQMLSQIDGHLTQDTFVFGVGEQGEIGAVTSDEGQQESIFNFDQISTGSAIARFPALVGQVMVVGAAFCLLWLWRPITRIKWLHERFLDTQTRIQYRSILLMITGAIILIISDFAMIFSLAISIGAPLVDTINTTFGEIWLARTILSFVILILAVIPLIKIVNKKVSITKHPFTGYNGSGSGSGRGSNRSKYVITSIIFILGLVTLLTTSLMGHAAAVSGSLLPVSLDYIHNVVASLWIGGVIYLAFVVAPILKKSISIKPNKDKDNKISLTTRKDNRISFKPHKSNNGEKDHYAKKKENLDDNTPDLLTINSILSIIIPRFSFVPVIILGAILMTGPFLLYILEDDLTLTLFSLYGIILLTKLVLAAVMIFIGIYYQMVIHKQSLNRLVTYSTQITSEIRQTQLLDKVNHNNDDDNDKNQGKLIKYGNNNSNITLKKIVSKFNSGLKVEAFVGILLLASVALLTNTGLPESETGIQGRQLSQNTNQIDEKVDSQGYTATRFLMNEMYNNDDSSRGIVNNSDISEKVNERNNQQQQIGQLSTTTTTNNSSISFIKARLAIEPFQPGNNRFIVSFIDANNNPVNFIDDVNIKMTKIGESIGSVSVSIAPIGLDTEEISTGVFTTNASFGFSGQWEIEVEGVTSIENASNLYTVFNPFIKPSLEQMTFNITEYNSTSPIQPLYPVYDDNRNVIWVGDTILNSGRILEFDIDADNENINNFLQHNISGASVITQLALDTNNSIWYIDPLIKVLGHYDPQTQSSENYDLFDSTQPVKIGQVFSSQTTNQNQQQQQQIQIPLSFSNATEAQGAPSALDIDSKNNIWITVANTNIVLKFDTSNKTFTKIWLPTVDANPLGVTVDENDVVWIAEGGSDGKIAKIDPNGNNYSIKEYSPKQSTPMSIEEDPTNSTVLNDPIFILPDPQGLGLYISEHEGQAISVFNPITETFRQISLENKGALPFGMAFDIYNNLWIAEHLTNKITVIDPVTEEQKDVTIPGLNPFNQYLTTDSKGQVWAPEQRGNALAKIDINVNSLPVSSGTETDGTDIISNDGDISYKISNLIETTGFERLAAPIIAVGIIIVALMYIRTVYTFSKSIEQVKIIEGKEIDRE